jgi:malate dehydrogenase (oxaloacetate-decarboxylating)
VLIGTTGQAGIFGEELIRTMARHAERPVVLAMSNPTSKTDGVPAEICSWTQGRALLATGSPFDPVEYHGRMIPVSQCNNVYVFPGIGMGAIVSRARKVTDGMFAAASETLARWCPRTSVGALYPPISSCARSAAARSSRPPPG